MPSAPYGLTSEFRILVAKDGVPTAFASEFVVLVACGAPPSRYTPADELVMLVSTHQDRVMTQVSEVCVLISYAAEATEKFNSRSWGFNLDQHQFYVLHLGMLGTVVFDVLTSEWSQWDTQGYTGWNAEAGVEWDGDVYFGDDSQPTLWKMDPLSCLDDDFRPIIRVVTGGIPAEARNTLRSGMFVLNATREGDIDDEDTPYVQLSISDDGGFTFKDRDALTIDGDKNTQDFSWRSLGVIRIPGRVFKITDEGGFVTIKGANQKIEGEDD